MISRTLCFGMGQAKEAKDEMFLFLASPVDTVDTRLFWRRQKVIQPVRTHHLGAVNV